MATILVVHIFKGLLFLVLMSVSICIKKFIVLALLNVFVFISNQC